MAVFDARGLMTDRDRRRFERKVDEGKVSGSPDGCWIWPGNPDGKGYGVFGASNKTMRAHRVSFSYFNGPFEQGLFVCHKCDVRICIRPDHLFVGSARDNSEDAVKKRRMSTPKGESNPMAKITRIEADGIFAMLSDGHPVRDIQQRYPAVSKSSISSMKRGRSWRWLADEIGFDIPPIRKKRSFGKSRRSASPLSSSDVLRFESKVKQEGECLVWLGKPDVSGYGAFSWSGVTASSHQVAFFLANGRWQSPGLDLAHKCHNKLCVRVEHLSEMTRAEHVRAAVIDGRYDGCHVGAKHNTKLTEDDVAAIRMRFSKGSDVASLTKEYKVSESTIRRVLLGHTWADVGGPICKGGLKVYRLGRPKLTRDDVVEIRYRSNQEDALTLAKAFGVTRRTVHQIIRGDTWKSVRVKVDAFNYPLKDARPTRDSDLECDLVSDVFEHYRKVGFPFPCYTKEEAISMSRLLLKAKGEIFDGSLPLSTTGMGLANSYHTHMADVRCRGRMTPRECFEDNDKFRKAILWRVRHGDDLRPHGIYKAIRVASGVQSVSNFRPVVAKALIQRFGSKFVVDPCAGYGGRVLGAFGAGVRYVGIDPCAKTVVGNRRLIEDIGYTDADIVEACCEDVLGLGHWNPDMVLTSPPYFDVEHYSTEPSQSYLRYPTFQEWKEGFLKPLVFGSFSDLSASGVFVLNVPHDMEPVVKGFADEAGFSFVEELVLPFNKRPYQKSGVTESVLVFRKPWLVE